MFYSRFLPSTISFTKELHSSGNNLKKWMPFKMMTQYQFRYEILKMNVTSALNTTDLKTEHWGTLEEIDLGLNNVFNNLTSST